MGADFSLTACFYAAAVEAPRRHVLEPIRRAVNVSEAEARARVSFSHIHFLLEYSKDAEGQLLFLLHSFLAADSEGKGTLSFGDVCKIAGLNRLTSPYAAGVFAMFDRSESGRVGFREYVSLMARVGAASSETARVQFAYDALKLGSLAEERAAQEKTEKEVAIETARWASLPGSRWAGVPEAEVRARVRYQLTGSAKAPQRVAGEGSEYTCARFAAQLQGMLKQAKERAATVCSEADDVMVRTLVRLLKHVHAQDGSMPLPFGEFRSLVRQHRAPFVEGMEAFDAIRNNGAMPAAVVWRALERTGQLERLLRGIEPGQEMRLHERYQSQRAPAAVFRNPRSRRRAEAVLNRVARAKRRMAHGVKRRLYGIAHAITEDDAFAEGAGKKYAPDSDEELELRRVALKKLRKKGVDLATALRDEKGMSERGSSEGSSSDSGSDVDGGSQKPFFSRVPRFRTPVPAGASPHVVQGRAGRERQAEGMAGKEWGAGVEESDAAALGRAGAALETPLRWLGTGKVGTRARLRLMPAAAGNVPPMLRSAEAVWATPVLGGPTPETSYNSRIERDAAAYDVRYMERQRGSVAAAIPLARITGGSLANLSALSSVSGGDWLIASSGGMHSQPPRSYTGRRSSPCRAASPPPSPKRTPAPW
mmetsp:Transcript_17575/g.60066  ORF Transcript_17575/g.60066 Transcript_17575/m.60066 type:complete len:650 (-) Transcript_17575:24-1973(-)